MGGCREPTQLYGNCSSQVEKDENGNCYKTCPYECSDSSPYANCRYDSQCMGCGFKKFRVNCDGSINPEWGDNSVLGDNNLDKIVKTNNTYKKDESITLTPLALSIPRSLFFDRILRFLND